jgi:argininosuccinate lyase
MNRAVLRARPPDTGSRADKKAGLKPVYRGRLKKTAAVELVQTANRLEIAYAAALYKGLSLADLAHTVMLAEAGIIPRPAAAELLKILLQVHDIPCDNFHFDPAVGDAYKNREHYILTLTPEAGGWLRTGRARREATNLAYQIAVRERLLDLVDALIDLATALLTLAEKHTATIMPDLTYLQHAQPTTLAHYLLSFVYPVLRDLDRLQAGFNRVNQCSGGIGSVNGSRLPFQRERLADLLGFEGAITHTRDAMWQADMPVEIMACVVALAINMDRLSEDLQIWATQEFNLVDLADEYCRDSVIMPQKKNPYSLAFIRGTAGVLIGRLTAMANIGKTVSGQPDSRIFAYGEVPEAMDLAIRTVKLMTGIMTTLTVHANIMARRTHEDYAQATDLAEVIMRSAGIPYLDAHHIVSRVVGLAAAQRIPATRITRAMIDRVARQVIGRPLNVSKKDLEQALQPRQIIATRTGLGGAAPAAVKRMIAQSRRCIKETLRWKNSRQRLVGDAEKSLVKLAQSLV